MAQAHSMAHLDARGVTTNPNWPHWDERGPALVGSDSLRKGLKPSLAARYGGARRTPSKVQKRILEQAAKKTAKNKTRGQGTKSNAGKDVRRTKKHPAMPRHTTV